MSMRSRGAAAAMNRTRTGVRPVYEDFKPNSEWKHDEGADILVYYLPGFAKDQLRIIAESWGFLKVRGERHVGGNKWSRFYEEVTVPEDCNMSGIRAKFEGGVLRITIPKKTTSSNTKHGTPSTSVPKPQQSQSQELPRKSPLPPIVNQPESSQNRLKEPLDQQLPPQSLAPSNTGKPNLQLRPRQPQDAVQLPQLLPPYFGSQTKPKQPASQELPPLPPIVGQSDPQKLPYPLQQELPPPPKFPLSPIAGTPLPKMNLRPPPVREQIGAQESASPFEHYGDFKLPQFVKDKDPQDSFGHTQLNATTNYEEPKGGHCDVESKHDDKNKLISTNISKESEVKKKYGVNPSVEDVNKNYTNAPSHEKISSKGSKKSHGLEDYRRSVKVPRRLESLEEDRQLLVNMGAAILVIAALGTYIVSSLGSSRQSTG